MKKFTSEHDLEQYTRKLIKSRIVKHRKGILLLENKKAVDIVICKNGAKSAIYFIEIKLHQKNHGRLGIGSRGGVGYQPEIVDKNPDYFKKHLRWLLVDNTKTERNFYFVTTDVIKKYISGGKIQKKFNNINYGEFFKKEKMLKEKDLIEVLKTWLIR